MTTPEPMKIHYVIVRRDIHRTVRGTSIGALAAQVVHAAGVSGAHYAAQVHPWTRSHPQEIIPADTIACVLGVPNERALKRLRKRLDVTGVKYHPVHEPDAPWNGALMAIGVWPLTMTDPARNVFSRLKLL